MWIREPNCFGMNMLRSQHFPLGMLHGWGTASGRDHGIFRCLRLQGMTPAQRLQAAQTKLLCAICLGSKCRLRSRLLYTMLQFNPSGQESRNPRRPTPIHAPPPHHVAEAITHAHVDTHYDQIILATAIILVQDDVGNYVPGRALLNS